MHGIKEKLLKKQDFLFNMHNKMEDTYKITRNSTNKYI